MTDILKLAGNSIIGMDPTNPVGDTNVQTLTNKTFTDNVTFFQNNIDTTKKLQFQLSDITASTTRTLTVPNANTIISGTDAVQTLTNKTINSDINIVQTNKIKSVTVSSTAALANQVLKTNNTTNALWVDYKLSSLSDTSILTGDPVLVSLNPNYYWKNTTISIPSWVDSVAGAIINTTSGTIGTVSNGDAGVSFPANSNTVTITSLSSAVGYTILYLYEAVADVISIPFSFTPILFFDRFTNPNVTLIHQSGIGDVFSAARFYPNLTYGLWLHDSAGVTFYINGTMYTRSLNSLTGSTFIVNSDLGGTSGVCKINGVAIWNRILNSTEVTNLVTELNTRIISGNPSVNNLSYLQYQISDNKWHGNRLNYISAVKTTNYVISILDVVIFCNGSTALTITLPTFTSVLNGYFYLIKDISGNAATNNITIDTSDSQTINGSSTYVINTNYGVVTICSNGTNWSII